MAKMNKVQLAQSLISMAQHVLADDSFEGSIEFSCIELTMEERLAPGEFEVKGAYRVGNSQGQGGMRIIS